MTDDEKRARVAEIQERYKGMVPANYDMFWMGGAVRDIAELRALLIRALDESKAARVVADVCKDLRPCPLCRPRYDGGRHEDYCPVAVFADFERAGGG